MVSKWKNIGWGPVANFFWGASAMRLVLTLFDQDMIAELKKKTSCEKSLEDLIKEKEHLEDLIEEAAAKESTGKE